MLGYNKWASGRVPEWLMAGSAKPSIRRFESDPGLRKLKLGIGDVDNSFYQSIGVAPFVVIPSHNFD